MYYYKTIVGTFYIKRVNNKVTLFIGDFGLGNYDNPHAAASDVYTHTTGYFEWDSLDGDVLDAPTDLSEWEFLHLR